MRIEYGHAHAYTSYALLSRVHYINLTRSVVKCKFKRYKSLTVHLPFEIQHREVENIGKAKRYIYFGEFLKRLFGVKLYWENAPWLKVGTWDLKYTNTNWKNIPGSIELCLDTGHLMLGSKDKKSFLRTLDNTLKERAGQIKHLHLHENDFVSDKHIPVPSRIISSKLLKKITYKRSYIIEKGE